MKRKIIIVPMTILIIVLLILGIKLIFPFFSIDKIYAPKQEYLNKVLLSNYNELNIISEYMNNINCDNARIDLDLDNRNTIFLEVGGNYSSDSIDNYEVMKCIDKLSNQKFWSIIKENNYIYFTQWISFNGDSGLIFCKDNYPIFSKTIGSQILEKSNKDNWFYFWYSEE